MIEGVYRAGEANGLAVWTHDQGGPYQTMPYPGHSWCAQGSAKRGASGIDSAAMPWVVRVLVLASRCADAQPWLKNGYIIVK